MANTLNFYQGDPPITTRKRLNNLCMAENYPFDDPRKYKEVFFPEFSEELRVISPPPEEADQYNCFAYALGLSELVKHYAFSQAITNQDLKEIDNPVEGDLVVYFDGIGIRHAGKYMSNTDVISKWARGPVFLHQVFMCPATYGNVIKYFGKISEEKAEWIFNNYPVLN